MIPCAVVHALCSSQDCDACGACYVCCSPAGLTDTVIHTLLYSAVLTHRQAIYFNAGIFVFLDRALNREVQCEPSSRHITG